MFQFSLTLLTPYSVRRRMRPDNPVHGVERFADRKRERRLADLDQSTVGRDGAKKCGQQRGRARLMHSRNPMWRLANKFPSWILPTLPVIMLACSLLPAPAHAQFTQQAKLVGTDIVGSTIIYAVDLPPAGDVTVSGLSYPLILNRPEIATGGWRFSLLMHAARVRRHANAQMRSSLARPRDANSPFSFDYSLTHAAPSSIVVWRPKPFGGTLTHQIRRAPRSGGARAKRLCAPPFT